MMRPHSDSPIRRGQQCALFSLALLAAGCAPASRDPRQGDVGAFDAQARGERAQAAGMEVQRGVDAATETRPPADETPAVASAASGAIATRRATPRPGGIRALHARRPPAGRSVELDAYVGEGYVSWPGRGGRVSEACPSVDERPLTDRPLWQTLAFGGRMAGNGPPAGEPYLVAVLAPELVERLGEGDEWAAWKALPGHARLRGHLPEPGRFMRGQEVEGVDEPCPEQSRIFVVEEVVETYRRRRPNAWWSVPPPKSWTTYRDAAAGFALRHPPSWTVRRDGPATVFASPHWPGMDLEVRVLDGRHAAATSAPDAEAPPDPLHLLFTFPDYVQPRESELRAGARRPPLAGRPLPCPAEGEERACLELRFEAGGRTYVLRQPFGTGMSVQPGLLEAFDAVVASLTLEAWPTVTPPPPLRERVGVGPFWEQARAEDQALTMISGIEGVPREGWRVSAAELISEAEALRRGRCDLNRDLGDPFYSYPEAVWLIELAGGQDLVYTTYLDAEDGGHLCTARLGGLVESGGGPYPAPGGAP